MFHAADRVLVGVMNNPRDFELARDEGWYRIPVAHAPASTTDAAVLAFYFTTAFDAEKWAIHWYAEVRGHELVRRRDLFPDEPDHPRADAPYYKLQIGPLIRRDPPILSLRWRRVTFIESTWDRFAAAEELNDLYVSGAEGLYVTLKESGFFPELNYLVREGESEYHVDLAVPCREGVVSVVLGDGPAPAQALRNADPDAVRAAVARLGGVQSPRVKDATADHTNLR
ncbi:MAG TPA: hypothetical protein PLJ78_13035 [Anaerolineae bacterium]|nr:hypothetical protein [Anaerolineae bacterium]HQK14854.1 hypothetical protein [Anaerolineae bacterium]